MDAFKNFAATTLAAGITNVAVAANVAAGTGARFPAVPFNATIWDSTTYAAPDLDPNVEIVRVTAIAVDALTITRGQEGTAAVAHNTGGKTYSILAGISAKSINNDLSRMLFAGAGPAAAGTGAGVDTSIMTKIIPAGTLEVGDEIEIFTIFRHGGGTTNAPRFRLKFGATDVLPLSISSATMIVSSLQASLGICLASGAAAQVSQSLLYRDTGALDATSIGTHAENVANAITLDWRIRFDAGAETIHIDYYAVFLKKKP